MSFVKSEMQGRVCVLRLDNGKPNSISTEVAHELSAALEEAEANADAVVLLARPGMFSAGFDLGTMGKGAEAARDMVVAGGALAAQIFDLAKPVVIGCEGHAIAMGAFLVMSGDFRVAARGAFKIGLNETAIGMTLPEFGFELARARLSKRHYDRAVVHSTIYDPEGALDAGFFDVLVEPDRVEAEVMAAAERLAELKQPAFRNNKRIAHRKTVDQIRSNLVENVSGLMNVTN